MFRRRFRSSTPTARSRRPAIFFANANIIKRTLESFGIAVEMGEINVGPAVTRYTLKPAEGIKLSRITALNPGSFALARGRADPHRSADPGKIARRH